MTRSAAFTFAVILGFLLVGLFGVMFFLLFPYETLLGPSATATFTSTPMPTATATIKTFLPTAGLVTPTPAEPTVTNTQVPTLTPGPTKTPTQEIIFPTPVPPRPTMTPTQAPPPSPGTVIPTATLPPSRSVNVSFEAESPFIERGECTNLIWQVAGPIEVKLNGQSVPFSSSREVCPERTTDYTLTVQVEGSAEIIPFQVRVNVTQ